MHLIQQLYVSYCSNRLQLCCISTFFNSFYFAASLSVLTCFKHFWCNFFNRFFSQVHCVFCKSRNQVKTNTVRSLIEKILRSKLFAINFAKNFIFHNSSHERLSSIYNKILRLLDDPRRELRRNFVEVSQARDVHFAVTEYIDNKLTESHFAGTFFIVGKNCRRNGNTFNAHWNMAGKLQEAVR